MKRRSDVGFTLIEALIASTVFFLCVSIAVMAFTAGSRNFSASRETIKAYQDTEGILEMITAELREANPSAGFTISPTQVTFRKYNKPVDEIQTVSWVYDGGRRTVTRSYTSDKGHSGSLEFGENIESMSFAESTDTRNSIPYRKVTVSMTVLGRKQSTVAGREIISLEKSVNLRRNQPFETDIVFTTE